MERELMRTACRSTGPFAVLLFITGGCEGDSVGSAIYTRTDSAGIEIVTSIGPSWTGDSEWSIASEPTVHIGVMEGLPAYQLNRVLGVVKLADGRIVVLNGGSQELRFFDAEGRFVRSVGGDGEGPGELRRATGLRRMQSDTLVVASRADTEKNVFSPRGEFVRRETLEYGALGPLLGQVYGCPWRPGLLPDGTYLTCVGTLGPAGTQDGGPVSHHLVRLPYDLEWADTIGVVSGPQMGVNFGSPGTVVASGRDPLTILLGEPSTFVIDVIGSRQGKVMSIRFPAGIAPVTESDRRDFANYLQEWQASQPAGMPPVSVTDRETAQVIPAFGDLVVDADGYVWAIEYAAPWEEPETALVFGADGQLLGPVAIPSGLEIFEIGTDYVLGVARDELDVESVRLYRLSRKAGRQTEDDLREPAF